MRVHYYLTTHNPQRVYFTIHRKLFDTSIKLDVKQTKNDFSFLHGTNRLLFMNFYG